MDFVAIKEWFFGLGAQYGVNPLIFGAIYVGAIPFFTLSLGWLVKNLRKKKSIVLPLFSTGFFFISAYLYLIIAGKNVPVWVYIFIVALIVAGGYSTFKKVKRKTNDQGSDGEFDYDLVVIGGGAAGLTASGMAASMGVKTAMIEAKKLGGDCTWYGCIPSKALLKSAKIANIAKNSSKYGILTEDVKVDFKAVMERVRTIREDVYEEADDPEIYRKMGIDVLSGKASFISENRIELKSESKKDIIGAKYFLIATGSKPVVPPIEGINEIDFLTNENIFELEKLPESLIVVGAGPIGIEMAQSFNRLGSKVTLIDFMDKILFRDDQELTEILYEKLKKEGIDFYLGHSVEKFEKDGANAKVICKNKKSGEIVSISGENVLLAVGRKANIEDLNLENIGVKTDKRGIPVDAKCRTNKNHIYACGDVAGKAQFTHYAEHMSKTAITNMILKIPMKLEEVNIPWCTYSDPEIAHVGMTEENLKERNESFEVYKFPYNKIDRALADSTGEGWIKVFAKKGSGKILGVNIAGEMAGDLICEFALAIKNNVSLRNMADTMHPYPTYGLGNRRAADQWYVRKQSVLFVKILKMLFGYRGDLPDLSNKERII